MELEKEDEVISLPMKEAQLFDAIRHADGATVERLLASGQCCPDCRVEGMFNTPALVLCVIGVDPKHCGNDILRRNMIETLIRYGADVDIKDAEDMTATMYAAERGFVKCLQFLVESAGADLAMTDKDGRSALAFSAMLGRDNCAEYIIKHVSKSVLDKKTRQGLTALMLAAREGKTRCVELLLTAGAGLETRDHAGYTAFMYALRNKCDTVVGLLLDKGACINVVAGNGKTPLTVAFETSHGVYSAWVLACLQRGADVGASRQDQDYLHEMVARGQKAVVRRMVMNGCPPLERVCKEYLFQFSYPLTPLSPLAVALLSRRPDIARYFIANHFLNRYDIASLTSEPGIRRAIASENDGEDEDEEDELKRKQAIEILDTLTLTPHSLFTLSFVSVSSVLDHNYFKPGSKDHKTLATSAHPDSLGARLQSRANLRNKQPSSHKPRKKCLPESVSTPFRKLTRKEKIELLPLPVPLKTALAFSTPSASICCRMWRDFPLAGDITYQSCLCATCEGVEVGATARVD